MIVIDHLQVKWMAAAAALVVVVTEEVPLLARFYWSRTNYSVIYVGKFFWIRSFHLVGSTTVFVVHLYCGPQLILTLLQLVLHPLNLGGWTFICVPFFCFSLVSDPAPAVPVPVPVPVFILVHVPVPVPAPDISYLHLETVLVLLPP